MLIQKSFYTYQQQLALPGLRREQKVLIDRLSSPDLKLEQLELVTELHATQHSELTIRDELRSVLNEPIHCLPFLQVGRLTQVRMPCTSADGHAAGVEPSPDWGWGIIVNFRRKPSGGEVAEGVKRRKRKEEYDAKQDAKSGSAGGVIGDYSVDVLIRCAVGSADDVAHGDHPRPSPMVGRRVGDGVALGSGGGGFAGSSRGDEQQEEEAHVVTLPLAYLDRLSSVRVKMPPDLRPADARFSMLKVLREVANRFPDGVPLLEPSKDLKVDAESVGKLTRRLETAQTRLSEERLREAALHDSLPMLRQRLAVAAAEREVRARMKEVEAVLMRDELKGMRRVLRRLGHLSDDGVIQNKGRVACELSTANELLTTELVFSGLLNELEPGPLAALLSCLVCEGGSKSGGGGSSGSGGGGGSAGSGGDGKAGSSSGGGGGGGSKSDAVDMIKTAHMREPFQRLREHARRVATTIEEARLEIDTNEFVEGFSTALVDVVVQWCEGAKFCDIVKLCDWFEGSIIRTFHRLEELLRQLIDASKVVGNEELEARCAAARKLLVRDVVFAASLYT